jgi:hypothetical protein
MERISGPYKGYFIAAYTVETDDHHFVGYAKVCVKKPGSVWNVRSVEKLTRATSLRTELEALANAEKKARQAIGQLVGHEGSITVPGALH